MESGRKWRWKAAKKKKARACSSKPTLFLARIWNLTNFVVQHVRRQLCSSLEANNQNKQSILYKKDVLLFQGHLVPSRRQVYFFPRLTGKSSLKRCLCNMLANFSISQLLCPLVRGALGLEPPGWSWQTTMVQSSSAHAMEPLPATSSPDIDRHGCCSNGGDRGISECPVFQLNVLAAPRQGRAGRGASAQADRAPW